MLTPVTRQIDGLFLNNFNATQMVEIDFVFRISDPIKKIHTEM